MPCYFGACLEPMLQIMFFLKTLRVYILEHLKVYIVNQVLVILCYQIMMKGHVYPYNLYHRLLYFNSFDLTFKKHGYQDAYYENFVPSAEVVGQYDVQMIPKEYYNLLPDVLHPRIHIDNPSLSELV